MTITEGAMVRAIIDAPPKLTDVERYIAHGKLLVTALYDEHPIKRSAARAAISRLLAMADQECPGA